MTKQSIETFFIDENEEIGSREELISPSGRFKLLLRYYTTKKGCWNYSRGTVYRLSDNKEICDIKRNYSHFAKSFVTKNNCEWLITGRSYMSQTIINLDTEEIFESDNDNQFCWINAVLTPDENTLIVNGCYWAAPEEYKFFDFSEPSQGWKELNIFNNGEKAYILDDDKLPDISLERIVFYQTSEFFLPLNKYDNDIEYETVTQYCDENPGAYDNEENWRRDIDIKYTVKRSGDKILIVDTWVSEIEKKRREKRRIANEKYDKWKKEFTSSDPLYLKYKECIQKTDLPYCDYGTSGITHEDWCPEFTKVETRWCRQIVKETEENKDLSIDLEWAVKTGPIKLCIRHNDKSYNKFFEHSAEAMQEAFDYAEKLWDSEKVKK